MRILTTIFLLLLSELTFSQSQCEYKIDSLKIILNENIPSFIDSLSKATLITKNNIDSIPVIIKLAILCWNKEFSIANQNEPFQVTDALGLGEKLPWRQLIYLGVSEHYVIFVYKHGGFALENHILLFRLEGNEIVDLWGGYSPKEVKNKREVLAYLKTIKNQINSGYIIL